MLAGPRTARHTARPESVRHTGGMAVVVLVLLGLVVALLLVGRVVAFRQMVGIAKAGSEADVTPLDPDLLPDVVRAAVASLEAYGFHLVAASRTDLGSRAPERTAHLVDGAGDTVIRVMSAEGHEAAGASVAAVSWYPGGFLATSRAASMSVQAREVLQTFPGVEPGEVGLRHRDAVDALALLGTPPLPLSEDLLGRLREDWRADSRAILAADPLTKLRWSGPFATAAKRATPLVERPDLPAIAAQLAAPTSAPT